jgi:hypothetical protein
MVRLSQLTDTELQIGGEPVTAAFECSSCVQNVMYALTLGSLDEMWDHVIHSRHPQSLVDRSAPGSLTLTRTI